MDIVSVLLGGAIGGVLRFVLAGLVQARYGAPFPLGTLAVNASGAFAIGLAAGWMGGLVADTAWLLLVVGILGSYTTVSSFSLQTLVLLQTGSAGLAMLNVGLSLALCLGLAALGLAIAS